MKQKISVIAILAIFALAAQASKYVQKPYETPFNGATLSIGIDPDGPLRIGGNLNAGAAASGVTATEYGDGKNHFTKLTFSNFSLGTLDLGTGNNGTLGTTIYTFPTGTIAVIDTVRLDGYLSTTSTNGGYLADTPDVGIGLSAATGAKALLSQVTNGENILTGQTFNDVNSTVEQVTVPGTDFILDNNSERVFYLNAADKFNAGANGANMRFTGDIILKWTHFE